jgi:decaprenyl-phosphate phosphoribosyltransferase
LTIVNLLRPRQWIKNLLIFGAPVAAKVSIRSYWVVLAGFLTFSLASSLGYVVNDWLDRKKDALHPIKKSRPFASKKLSGKDFAVYVFFLSFSVIALLIFLPEKFVWCVITYLMITVSYSLRFKNVPVIEIIWLATGFLIRAVAGGALLNLQVSSWFLLFSGFGAIYIVAAKRFAELKSGGGGYLLAKFLIFTH